jgi:hypothetical protein
LALCRGLGVSLWSLLLIDRLRLLRLLGLCLALKQVGKLRWARNVGWPTLWSRLGLLWLWRLRVTLGSRLGRIALGLLWLCVLRLLRRLLLGRLGIPLRSLLACKGAILCLGQGRNTAGQARLLVAGINWLQVKPNVELNARLAVVVSFVLTCAKCSICFL